MKKGNRLPERLYALAMWVVSAAFAVFLIGLGGLVIDDLPRRAGDVSYQPHYPEALLRRDRAIDSEQDTLRTQRESDEIALTAAQSATSSAKEAFQAWIETRKATTDQRQDTELTRRTEALEQLQRLEHQATQKIEAIDQRAHELGQQKTAIEQERDTIAQAYRPVYARAVFMAQLRVFLMRLAFTLPLLLLSAWLVMRKRQSAYWPLYRGFVLASLYAFFVELVPYLPSYGGYVRYGVGALLTVIVCVVLIRNMQAYLARRRIAEAESEKERRQRVDREQAYAKIEKRICPDCDRPIARTEGMDTNFCVHCGLTLYQHCLRCDTRNMAFNRFCLSCGAEDLGQAPEKACSDVGPAEGTQIAGAGPQTTI
ncbi:zinc ribbon domain-containing protein [Asaia bogorensis]|uniref:zinc ribbon domain-containing protein n=1 Tax=Asaia bogorensis TaxID=91915 RepID=UPI001968C7E7|nr:hypothetical protein [Asaia bogorensis]